MKLVEVREQGTPTKRRELSLRSSRTYDISLDTEDEEVLLGEILLELKEIITYMIDLSDDTVSELRRFSGSVYSNTRTMANDGSARFSTNPIKLLDVVILVETNSMLVGSAGSEVYTIGADETVGFTKLDISTLYFKNASAGSNGKISILGVRE